MALMGVLVDTGRSWYFRTLAWRAGLDIPLPSRQSLVCYVPVNNTPATAPGIFHTINDRLPLCPSFSWAAHHQGPAGRFLSGHTRGAVPLFVRMPVRTLHTERPVPPNHSWASWRSFFFSHAANSRKSSISLRSFLRPAAALVLIMPSICISGYPSIMRFMGRASS